MKHVPGTALLVGIIDMILVAILVVGLIALVRDVQRYRTRTEIQLKILGYIFEHGESTAVHIMHALDLWPGSPFRYSRTLEYVHALENQEHLESYYGPAVDSYRGGRPRVYYRITSEGTRKLEITREQRQFERDVAERRRLERETKTDA